MYNSIVVTNAINCRNKKVIYQFTLVLDTVNWQTSANLKVLDKEYITVFPGDFFTKVNAKIQPLFDIPHDPEGKVYEGPEIKIKLTDKFGFNEWSNMTNVKCEFDKAFKIPNLYVSQENQAVYDNVISFLVKLSNIIFGDKIEKN